MFHRVRLRKFHTAFVASLISLAGLVGAVQAATITFTPGTPTFEMKYAGLVIGSGVDTIGWTGTDPVPKEVVGATPRTGGYGGSTPVITPSTTGRKAITSPAMPASSFELGDVVYVSGWFNRINANTSGARVLLRTDPFGYAGGFGILDQKGSQAEPNPFALYGGTGWHYSNTGAIADHWYEIALVIAIDPVDITLSLGYLFVRDATLGETEFRLIEDLAGISMGYTEAHNINNFKYWRIEGLQNQAQLGSLAIGKGVLSIPEPSTVALQIAALLAFGGLGVMRRLGRRKH